MPRVDRVLVLTEHQKSHVESTYRLKAPAEVIGFAVDDEFFHPLPVHRGDYILAVGDDVGRDYALLVAACRSTPYQIVLRTNQPPPIPEDMRDRVTILGRQSYLQLRDLYASAALVVVPLHPVDHPSGVTVVFEAMAMGCAVIASSIGTTRDTISDQETGLLLRPGDLSALRHAIDALMASPETRRAMGLRARQAIEGRLSYDKYIARFAAALQATENQTRRNRTGRWLSLRQ
jgi:glycosyltransferase involved in cell wall biosynthesis